MKHADSKVYNDHNDVIYHHFASIDSVELWVTSLARIVGICDWKSDMNFTQCGGDSFQLVQVINMIENNLGSKVNSLLCCPLIIHTL